MTNNSSIIKVIVSDLDGTLLNQHHKISDFTKKVFQKLHQLNYVIIVATGRHHIDAQAIVSDIGFPVYLVTSNGARVHSPQNELLYSFDIQSSAIKSVLALDIDPEITTVLFKEKYWLTSKVNEKLNSFQKEMTYPYEVVNFDDIEDCSAIKMFFTHDNHTKLVDLKDKILVDHANKFNHAFSLPICLEFMDKSVDKSVAIQKILEIEGFTFKNVMAFGDGFNDEEMLLKAEKGLIMHNAPATLKAILFPMEVIGSNDQDAVANYCTKELL